MEPTQKLLDEIYLERIERARAAPLEEKLLDGPRLFDRVCAIMKDGIRMQFPNASEAEVRLILLERLAIAEELENQQ
jgi:hypothetical protein